MKIAVLGGGSWGTTLADLLAENNPGKEVMIWIREKEIAAEVNEKHQNNQYLKGVELSEKLTATSDVLEAVKDADLLVTAIPSQFLRSVLDQIKGKTKKGITVLNVAKGFELRTFERMSQIIAEEIPDAKVAVLSGPNHAEEVSQKIPTATVIASKDADQSLLKETFETSYFKVYPHDDLIGLEICGAVKNITALATGVVSGLGLGDNASGSIITLGLREMVTLGRKLGANEKTFYGLAGVGDLVATCMSEKSRNRRAGQLLAKGMGFDQIKEEMHGMVAEGIMTCKAVHEYAEKNGINMPLTAQAYKVLFEEKDLHHAIEDLKKLI
jgi:glycerol-3-phosphate dehydrogenase (NAD(P)+)